MFYSAGQTTAPFKTLSIGTGRLLQRNRYPAYHISIQCKSIYRHLHYRRQLQSISLQWPADCHSHLTGPTAAPCPQELAAQDSVEYEDVGDLVLPLHTDAPAPAAAVKAPLPFEPPYLSSHESLPFAHQRRVSGLENIPENGSMRRAMSAQPSRSRSAGRGPSASNSQRSQRPASGISSGASEKLGVYTREGAVSHRFIDLDAAPKLPPHSPNAYYYGAGGEWRSRWRVASQFLGCHAAAVDRIGRCNPPCPAISDMQDVR